MLERYLSNAHWKKFNACHDIVMMDYSGTGFSGPYMCQDLLDSLSMINRAEILENSKKKKTIELYASCRDSLNSKNIPIEAFTTFQAVADAEEIRKSLSIDQWDIYSVSYGTFAAMMYMRYFESSLGNVVLDSPCSSKCQKFQFCTHDE
ncbi:MAG: alpha/beta fold hydrolase [Flavobacteriales bacterium]